MMNKSVMFHMDGTFIDSRPLHARLFYEFFKKNANEMSYERCYELVGTTVRTLFSEDGIKDEEQERYFGLLNEFYDAESGKLVPLTHAAEGFRELLIYLKERNVITIVVTNSLNCIVDKFMTYYGFKDLFTEIMGADKNSHDKTERCGMLLKKYGLKPSEVIYVGDTETDMELARLMGFDACFAKTPIAWYHDAEKLAREYRPEITVTDFKQLYDHFKSI